MSDNLATSLLDFDGAKETKEVHQHDVVSKLRLIIEAINPLAILRKSGEGNDIIEIKTKSYVNIVNEHLHILLETLVEWNDSQSGTTAGKMLEDALVILHGSTTVTRSCDNNMCTTGQDPHSWHLAIECLKKCSIETSVDKDRLKDMRCSLGESKD